ncbi:MAG TPA: N-acetylmuramoyl-L-alanine amidase [Armatimonadota bacterium]|jgi:N-acetylmuramoyl-L-alanine amidase
MIINRRYWLLLLLLLLGLRAQAGAVVCLDAGHPSEVNAGRTVQHGVTEVTMNWQVTQRLAAVLRARGVTVVLTKRTEREYVSNRRRAEIANAAHAALLLRLHCDTGRGSGITVYYPDRPGRAQGVTGPSRDVLRDSAIAANLLHDGAAAILGSALHDNGVKGERATYIGRRQGALTGSIFSQLPVVTVEMVFLSNLHDARFIRSPRGQQLLANALAEGVMRYLGEGPQRVMDLRQSRRLDVVYRAKRCSVTWPGASSVIPSRLLFPAGDSRAIPFALIVQHRTRVFLCLPCVNDDSTRRANHDQSLNCHTLGVSPAEPGVYPGLITRRRS